MKLTTFLTILLMFGFGILIFSILDLVWFRALTNEKQMVDLAMLGGYATVFGGGPLVFIEMTRVWRQARLQTRRAKIFRYNPYQG